MTTLLRRTPGTSAGPCTALVGITLAPTPVLTLALALVLAVSAPSTAEAGPIKSSALSAAASITPAQTAQPSVQPSARRVYTKSGLRSTLEWAGIIGGGIALLATEQACDGLRIGDTCVGERTWPAGRITASSGVFAAALISKLMPDPQ